MSRFILPGGRVVQEDTPFVIDQNITVLVLAQIDPDTGDIIVPEHTTTEVQQVQYPGVRGLSAGERALLGITEIVEDPMPDIRYGFASEDPANPGKWLFAPFSSVMLKERLTDYAKSVRDRTESAGITVGGVPVPTDDRSKMMLMGVRMAAAANSSFSTEWTVSRVKYVINATQIVAMSDAVLAHVDHCFTVYNAVLSGIANGSIVTYEAVDAAFAVVGV